ncbi:hypothetical protein R1sor_024968 [Riccia sorocarpa]|uniref:CCHC-type domain-containing protein n=1 Tax=Riccia sorocarpa TaxID=122646 RepID=A0ABD3GAD1_9MARC
MLEQQKQKSQGQPEDTVEKNTAHSQQPRSYAAATCNPNSSTAKTKRKELTAEEVQSRVADILKTIPKPQEGTEPSKILKYTLSDGATESFGRKTLELEEKAVIMYIGGINPLRDMVAKWSHEQFAVKLKLNIKQLQVLDRSHYLLTLETEEERAKILNAGPQYLNGRFVELMPWIADYDKTTLTRKRKPAWVSIAGLSPSLEGEGRKILSKLGKVLHMSGVDQQGRNKFFDVRGMVLLLVDVDHPEAIEIDYDGSCAEFKLYYEFLPEGCYTCHEVGHVARFCPQTTSTREVSKAELEEALRAARETKRTQENEATDKKRPVCPVENSRYDSENQPQGQNNDTSSSGGQRDVLAISVANPFDLLGSSNEEDDLEEDEDEEMGEEVPTIRIETQAEKTTPPGLDLNAVTTEETSPSRTLSAQRASSPEDTHEDNHSVEDMDASIAQKRVTYGNASSEADRERRISRGRPQEKKSRALTDI